MKIPIFNYQNLASLAEDLDEKMTEEHWKLFNDLWLKFGFDDHFGPHQYSLSFSNLQTIPTESVTFMDRIFVMKLPKSKLLTPYGSICFIYLLDLCQIKKPYVSWIKKIFRWLKDDQYVKTYRLYNDISDNDLNN